LEEYRRIVCRRGTFITRQHTDALFLLLTAGTCERPSTFYARAYHDESARPFGEHLSFRAGIWDRLISG